MAIARWLKMFCALGLAATSLGCDDAANEPPIETTHFAIVDARTRDYCGSLASWKLAHPTKRIINLLPRMGYFSPSYQPNGFVVHSLEMGVPVQQFFVTLHLSTRESTRMLGVDLLEGWMSQYPEAEVMAIAPLNHDSSIQGYLICFEMPTGTPLPDSLTHYYQSLPVEPNEFTPLTDAKAPLMETTLP